jgi:hypothetical protein
MSLLQVEEGGGGESASAPCGEKLLRHELEKYLILYEYILNIFNRPAKKTHGRPRHYSSRQLPSIWSRPVVTRQRLLMVI